MKRRAIVLSLGIVASLCAGHLSAKPAEPKYDLENDEIRGAGPKVSLDGIQMKAFMVAYTKFQGLDFLAPEEKRLQNYTVGFSRDKMGILVYFTPKPIPNDPNISAANANGVPLLFVVESKTFRILEYGVLS